LNRRLRSTKEGVGETSGETARPTFLRELALTGSGQAEGFKNSSFVARDDLAVSRRSASAGVGEISVLTCSPTPSFFVPLQSDAISRHRQSAFLGFFQGPLDRLPKT
jgi:hypothetical protein